MSVHFSLHVLTRAHCAQWSPSIPLWLVCTPLHLLEEGHNHPIVHLAYLCHMTGKELVYLYFMYIKLFELGVEVAFNNRSAVTHHKVNVLRFPLRSRYSERTDDAFVLLICFCFFHLSRNPSSLSVDRLKS